MERKAAVHRYEDLHKAEPWHDGTFQNWAAARSDEFPYHLGDGTTIVVSKVDHNPDDRFLDDPDDLD
jgi:hypothetical protein